MACQSDETNAMSPIDNAVIGCGSIETHDIPPRVVAAGNPCRVIRQITDADKVGFVK